MRNHAAPIPRTRTVATGYLVLLLAAVGAFFLIRWIGEGLVAPASAEVGTDQVARTVGTHEINVVFHVLATLASVIALGNVLARIFRYMGQPAVIGEVVAGIALGPSLLGATWPDAMHLLIPGPDIDSRGQVLTAVKTIAQLGVVLYMFVVGLELNTTKLEGQARTVVAIAHASIVIPFVSGAALALWLYPRLSHGGVPFTSFALFLGVAMAITAFPVLARILTDRSLETTELGVLALSCAAAGDATAWCLLALTVGVAQAQIGDALLVSLWSLAFIVGMFFLVRPVAARFAHWFEQRPESASAGPWLFVALLVAALTTEAIGIHAVFGAFLLGAIIPHDSRIARELSHKLSDVVTILFLPAFFAITGMQTRFGLIEGADIWLMCLAIVLVATVGKFGGTLLAARFTGLDWKTSSALGVLMNTRGLMELIVLNIGLSLGVISPTLFAMMVIMALVTTMATSPILQRLVPAR